MDHTVGTPVYTDMRTMVFAFVAGAAILGLGLLWWAILALTTKIEQIKRRQETELKKARRQIETRNTNNMEVLFNEFGTDRTSRTANRL
jgi:cytidylate kinase